MARKDTSLFQVGDLVKFRTGDEAVYIVSWISKGATTRDDQLIATERNGYCNPTSWASVYERVQQ